MHHVHRLYKKDPPTIHDKAKISRMQQPPACDVDIIWSQSLCNSDLAAERTPFWPITHRDWLLKSILMCHPVFFSCLFLKMDWSEINSWTYTSIIWTTHQGDQGVLVWFLIVLLSNTVYSHALGWVCWPVRAFRFDWKPLYFDCWSKLGLQLTINLNFSAFCSTSYL